MQGYHRSVLLKEVVDVLMPTHLRQDGLALAGRKGIWYLDCTLGDGGHSLEILKLGGNVLGLDVDPKALERAEKRFKDSGVSGQYKLIQGNFRDLKNLIQKQMDTEQVKFAGAIFDLGVSSLQLESPERGFSFAKEGPLDMRMDPNLQVRALDLVNGLNKGELYELFNRLGEEKFSRSLAEAVVSARGIRPIQTTKELAEIARKIIGNRSGKIHPATKIFQALRIAINDELNVLKEGLIQVRDIINGCICVISFHSLEDRITKNTFRDWEKRNLGEIVTKKPILPSEEEIIRNPRARSAKLRIFKTYDYN